MARTIITKNSKIKSQNKKRLPQKPIKIITNHKTPITKEKRNMKRRNKLHFLQIITYITIILHFIFIVAIHYHENKIPFLPKQQTNRTITPKN